MCGFWTKEGHLLPSNSHQCQLDTYGKFTFLLLLNCSTPDLFSTFSTPKRIFYI